jgi:hypothetical protein
MELIQGSETSANYNLKPGKYPKEHTEYGMFLDGLKKTTKTLPRQFLQQTFKVGTS